MKDDIFKDNLEIILRTLYYIDKEVKEYIDNKNLGKKDRIELYPKDVV
jgi:hypothetical protein